MDTDRHHPPHGRETPDRNPQANGMRIQRYGRYWAVYEPNDTLVVVTVYKKGAHEVVRRLTALAQARPLPIGKADHEPS